MNLLLPEKGVAQPGPQGQARTPGPSSYLKTQRPVFRSLASVWSLGVRLCVLLLVGLLAPVSPRGGPLLDQFFPLCDGDVKTFTSSAGETTIAVTATTYNGQPAMEMRIQSGSGNGATEQRRYFRLAGDQLLYLGMNFTGGGQSLEAVFSPPISMMDEATLASGGSKSGRASSVLRGSAVPGGAYSVDVEYAYSFRSSGPLAVPACQYPESQAIEGEFTFLDPADPEDPELQEFPEFLYLAPGIGIAKIQVYAVNQFGILIPRGFAELTEGQVCGAPLCAGGLQVTIEPSGAVGAGAQWRRMGTTAWRNSGETEVGLAAGEYSVEFKPALGWHAPEQQTVAVVGGQTSQVNAAYSPMTYSLSGFVRDTHARGAPIPGVAVTLRYGRSVQTVQTGEDGRYQFSGLSAGSYGITPSNEDYAFAPDTLTIELAADIILPPFTGTQIPTTAPELQLDPAFVPPALPEGSAFITTLSIQADQKIIVGCDDCELDVHGVGSDVGIARLNPDGSADLSFNPGFGASANEYMVNKVSAQADGTILVAGGFESFDGIARRGMVRLLPDGSVDPSFDPGSGFAFGPFSPGVKDFVVLADGKIVVIGDFESVDGRARPGIARLHSNGALDETFNPGPGFGPSNTVSLNSIALTPGGQLLIGGSFETYDGVTAGNIVRLSLDGSPILPHNLPAANGRVVMVKALQDGKALIAGAFDQVNGTTRHGIARLQSDGSVDLSFDPELGIPSEGFRGVRSATELPNGGYALFGRFPAYTGTETSGLVIVADDGSLTTSLRNAERADGLETTIADGAVDAEERILFVGDFDTVAGHELRGIARITLHDSDATAPCLQPFESQPPAEPGSPSDAVRFEFSDGYAWLINDTVLAGRSELCGSFEIEIVVGALGEYHHALGTDLVRYLPKPATRIRLDIELVTIGEAPSVRIRFDPADLPYPIGLQSSSDLIEWSILQDFPSAPDGSELTIPIDPGTQQRFFRAVNVQ